MGLIRRHSNLIAKLAGLAMLAHVLAAAFCPNMASHNSSKGYVDSVLGWVTLCVTDSQSNGPAGSGQSHDGHSSLCASLCAAVVTTLAAFTAFILAAIVSPILTSVVFKTPAPRAQRRFLFGGIGSRAPPAFV
jgi:hypothetical protein